MSKEKKLVNLTPHDINVVSKEDLGIVTTIPKSDVVARATTSVQTIGDVNGIPLRRREFGEIENLPEPKKDTIYIVSKIVAEACPLRNDLIITDELVRDDKGKPIGITGFATL